ncbi:branched-chain amino acid transaminase [Thalassotalea euphylliae]|uniref:Branched-chain-amino-acid aminotransferase n=1 Tax=Thalassotalea euphylliae TaxID=1655234 RepID=A0A3E0U3Z4_9GAMM|nr:branched-chain amino acid transaminase [Thalassotalea euphylliae]REL31307.1 branched-chain amino acid transaminase [Thalassotalea euphylliae]
MPSTTKSIPETKPISSPHHEWVFLNGEYVPSGNASVPITTQAFNYGTAVFEGIRGYVGKHNNELNIFRLNDHIERLLSSAKILSLNNLPTAEELEKSILSLLKRNGAMTDCYIRPIAYKQHLLPGTNFGVKLSGQSSGLSINSLAMGAYTKTQGINCTISSWQRVSDNSIPARAKITGSYVNSALAMEAAQKNGFDDAIMLNAKGHVAEATTSNVFIVKDGKLITPSINDHILEGITRKSIIALARSHFGLPVEERSILPSELLSAQECFLTGTGVEVTPVIQIDHQKLKTNQKNSLTIRLKELYSKVVRGELSEFKKWLTPLY